MTNLPFAALATLLIVLVIFGTGLAVGRTRGLYGIKAPAMTGHEMFERAYRVQMNTLENAALVLPSLWLYAALIGDIGAGAMGLVWVLARIWYAKAYLANPAKRGPAFGLSIVAFAGLWLGALWGVVRIFMHHA